MRRREGIFLLMLGLYLLQPLLSSCSNQDDRDVCCEELRLVYRYIREDRDEYQEHIHSLRHFLFDASGRFLREVPSNASHPQDLRLYHLPEGRYTMLTLANAEAVRTRLSELVEQKSRMQDFELLVVNRQADGSYGPSDRLYWNVRHFDVQRKRVQRYLCDLSNIHCRLYVRVWWHSMPKHNGVYRLELQEAPLAYYLNPEGSYPIVLHKSDEPKGPDGELTSTEKRVVHRFPALKKRFGTYTREATLFNLSLTAEFITLRYTNKEIPTFRLYYGDEAMSKPIDLARTFEAWGWRPDEHPLQVYRIEIEIRDDGTVLVHQWSDASVLDWVDGGTIGATRYKKV